MDLLDKKHLDTENENEENAKNNLIFRLRDKVNYSLIQRSAGFRIAQSVAWKSDKLPQTKIRTEDISAKMEPQGKKDTVKPNVFRNEKSRSNLNDVNLRLD